MKRLRIYVDASVVGGCWDHEFEADSRRLLDAARNGDVILLVSEILVRELATAPERVRSLLSSLPSDAIEVVPITDEIVALQDAYLAAGIVGARWRDDAAHVAAATVARADAIVSWNFRHIVRLDKIKAYNQVNLLNGYGILTILTPKEALPHGQDT